MLNRPAVLSRPDEMARYPLVFQLLERCGDKPSIYFYFRRFELSTMIRLDQATEKLAHLETAHHACGRVKPNSKKPNLTMFTYRIKKLRKSIARAERLLRECEENISVSGGTKELEIRKADIKKLIELYNRSLESHLFIQVDTLKHAGLVVSGEGLKKYTHGKPSFTYRKALTHEPLPYPPGGATACFERSSILRGAFFEFDADSLVPQYGAPFSHFEGYWDVPKRLIKFRNSDDKYSAAKRLADDRAWLARISVEQEAKRKAKLPAWRRIFS